jgi:DNA repair protein RadC
MELIREINDGKKFSTAKDVYNYLDEFRDQDREMLIIIGLDARNKPCYREINTIGTLNTSLIHPREVFKKAIIMSCNSIIMAHNHPSGETTPSNDDLKTTKRIKEAGEILDIKLIDHIIITKDNYNSIIDMI